MRGPIRNPEGYAPTQRSRECDCAQNRKFRRNATCMSEGARRQEMRAMYIEIGKFALKANDNAVQTTLLDKFRRYTRLNNPASAGIKSAHAEMTRWYDEVRADYLAAHREDAACTK